MLYNKPNPFSFSARNNHPPSSIQKRGSSQKFKISYSNSLVLLDQKCHNTLELPMVDSDRDLSIERRLKNIVTNEAKDFSEAQKYTNCTIKTNRPKKKLLMLMSV